MVYADCGMTAVARVQQSWTELHEDFGKVDISVGWSDTVTRSYSPCAYTSTVLGRFLCDVDAIVTRWSWLLHCV